MKFNEKKVSNNKLIKFIQRSKEIYTLESLNDQLLSNDLLEVNTIKEGVFQILNSGMYMSIVDFNEGYLVLFESKRKLRKYIEKTNKIANKEQEKECGSSIFLIKHIHP